MRKHLIIIIFATILASCSNNEQKTAIENKAPETNTTMEAHDHFKPEMVVNKVDFACGMPVSAGISDTAQFEGKSYGFCSSECKAEFQKEPAKYLAAKQ